MAFGYYQDEELRKKWVMIIDSKNYKEVRLSPTYILYPKVLKGGLAENWTIFHHDLWGNRKIGMLDAIWGYRRFRIIGREALEEIREIGVEI